MKDIGILFKGAMVRATLADLKTQTRRGIKPQPQSIDIDTKKTVSYNGSAEFLLEKLKCPYGKVGDRLWVKETFASDEPDMEYAQSKHEDVMSESPVYYRADKVNENTGLRWRPSIHMPRWASRITLEVVSVRVERVQEITVEDAIAEGVGWAGSSQFGMKIPGEIFLFKHLWDSINAKRGFGWDENPWVWVLEFKRIEQ